MARSAEREAFEDLPRLKRRRARADHPCVIADPDPVAEGLPLPVPAHVASALPDLLLSAFCLVAWIAPTRVGPGAVRWILLTMMLEFVVMHSAAFMGRQFLAPGDRRRRATAMLGLGVFYSTFAGAFALAFHTWWPLASFWMLTLNRLTGVLFRQAPSGEERAFVQAGWAASALCYLLGAAVTTLLPLPALGLTPDVVRSLALPGSGLWIDQPWRVVAFGALYFGAVGAFEWTGFRALRAGLPVQSAR